MPLENPELQMLRLNKEDGYNYRERRQDDWLENYTLYRDKVIINRLTQRQSVNMPLMKMAVRTLLKDVDDLPVLYFENLDNDKEAEVFQNEYWKWTGDEDHNKFSLQDIVDKKQIFHFGRSFDQWQIIDGVVRMTVQDPQDMLVSRYCDPFNLHSSRYLVHTHIFKPLSSLANNPMYDQRAIMRLKEFYATQQGLIKAATNAKMLSEKNKKMQEMGVPDVDSPVLGETYVELSLDFVMRDKETKKGQYFENQIFMYVDAEDMEILMKAPLEEVIGSTKDKFWQTHFPYNSWADDLDRQDFWTDSIADIIRPANKVLNAWFSQLVENRTLRNFGMHYYNSNLEGFVPGTFNPVPWGWYGIPVPAGGRIADVLQKVDIPDLSESLDEMKFVIEMAEKATGATTTQQGAQTQRQVTLGEVQLALGEAKERIKGMSKFYTPVWQQRGRMFLKMIEAGADKLKAVKIYKKGRNTSDIHSREITPKDWMTKSGYREKVWSQDEKNNQDTQSIQKLNAVKVNIPMNPKLDEIYQRKLLEFADLTPDEVNDVMQYEQQKRDMMLNQPNLMLGTGQMTQMPLTAPQTLQTPTTPPMVSPMKVTKKKTNKSKAAVGRLKSIRSNINKL